MATEIDRYRHDDPLSKGPMGAAEQHTGQRSSMQGLHSALQQLDASTSDRFLKLQDTALEQCQETDDSDLRRLKKHFKTLKNTFTVYDLKEGFIEGLLQGLPDGTEEEKLWSFEEDMERNSVLLRQYKSQNKQAQAQMVELMEDIAQARQLFTAQRDGCAAQLDALAEEEAEYAQEQQQQSPDAGSADYAALQAKCLESMQAETAQQESCEAALASHQVRSGLQHSEHQMNSAPVASGQSRKVVLQADIEEMKASISSATQELQLLQAQIAAAEAGKTAARQESETNHRFVAHAKWCDHMLAVVSALSGVSIVSNDDDKLVLNIVTNVSMPSTATEGQASSSLQHTLELCFANGSVQKATLQPADVDIDSTIKLVVAGRQGVSFVVREVQAALRNKATQNLQTAENQLPQ